MVYLLTKITILPSQMYIWEGLRMEIVGMFYVRLVYIPYDHLVNFTVHLVNFTDIWYFFQFWYAAPRKIWQPCIHLVWSLIKRPIINFFDIFSLKQTQ
jgi:hypothetical protein